MTKYSVYEPAAPTHGWSDVEIREQQMWTFTNGAARAVLDTAQIDGSDEGVAAVNWQSPEQDWELHTIDPVAGRREFRARMERFFDAHYDDLEHLVELIRVIPSRWAGDYPMAWYRAGMLYTYSCRGEGIGFFDYPCQATDRLQDAAGKEGNLQAIGFPAGHDLEHLVEMLEV